MTSEDPATPEFEAVPVVAVVGRPNVGKSSLVNRVLGRREAIVQERPGVTRDRRAFAADWDGRRFEIVDTGGLEPGAEGLDARITEQAHVAMEAADLILLVVDATTGYTKDDLEVARMLRRSPKPVIVVVNKVDRPGDPAAVAEFFGLGLGDPIPVSALHGTGSGDLLSALVKQLPEVQRTDARNTWASIAIVGRPNVGKSSILNSLTREQRAIVHDVPGTTRDPVDSDLVLPSGRVVTIVDTAGMRREVQLKDPVEYFSWLRSRRTLERVDACILVVDADEGVTGHDQRIAEEIVATGRACVVALNKWDLRKGEEDADRDRWERRSAEQLRFLPWAEQMRVSAKTRRGIDKLLPAVELAVESHRRRLPTGTLNRLIRQAGEEKPHPRLSGRAVRVLYAVQAKVGPPTVLLFTNGPMEPSYLRYLDRRLRESEPFRGSPVRFELRLKAPRER
jgi:GTP-binding protein